MGLGIVSVLVTFSLAAGSAWATAPTLETSFTGPEGGSAGHLAVNERTGEIFVLDEPKDAVDRYTSAGVLIEEIEGSKIGLSIGNPKYDKIAVDSASGNLYVSLLNNEAVFAFKLEAGGYQKIWQATPGRLPTGLAVDGSGHPWFTVFYERVIVELNPSNGETVRQVNTPGVEPENAAFDSKDHMFVGYRNGNDVVELDPTTGTSLGSGVAGEPSDIAVDTTTSNLFVATFGYVEVLTPTWAQLSGTPFFAETTVVAVNGAAGKLYTATGNQVNVWNIAHSVPVGVAKTGVGGGSVASTPTGIECGAVCSAGFEEGETVTLIAAPESGSAVAGWTGCVYVPRLDECEVNVGQVNKVAVDFAKTVSLTVNETGSGTVTSAPAGIDCGATCSASFLKGTRVTLTARPAAHGKVAWEGCASEPAVDECEVTVNAAMSVSAVFSVTLEAVMPVTATLSTVPASGGGGRPSQTPVSKPKPIVKSAKCKRGYVRQKVHGRVRCVKAKVHKSKKRARKHH
ncbi:MAG TPA: hypothetical protein VGY30_12600 [Solirubrobacteraceae bacterium]|nr:hypothetical protein [Solirubrobacteraceae bacterium]